MGNAVVIVVLAVIVFFAARSTIKRIKAELRGECSCDGCSQKGQACCACMQQVEELRKLKERKRQL